MELLTKKIKKSGSQMMFFISMCLFVVLLSKSATANGKSPQNIMKIHDIEATPGDVITIEIEIINDQTFVGFNLDVLIPDGFIFIEGSTQLYRKTDHMFGFNVQPPGNIAKIIAFSLTNSPFTGNDGIIFSFDLETPMEHGEYLFEIANAVIGTVDMQNILTGTINGTLILEEEAPDELPLLEFAFNGIPAGPGDSFDHCFNEQIFFTLETIIAGAEPFDIEWETNGSTNIAYGIGAGDPLFYGFFDGGVYNIMVTSITDANGVEATDLSEYFYTVVVYEELSYIYPSDAIGNACDYTSQAGLEADFDFWFSAQTTALDVQGGYAPVVTHDWDSTYLDLCNGGEVLVTWTITDICETAQVSASFTLTAPDPLTYNLPGGMVAHACDFADQAALEDAFEAWLASQTAAFDVNDGCNPQLTYEWSGIYPQLCISATTTVTWTITDLCETVEDITAHFILEKDDIPIDLQLAADADVVVGDIGCFFALAGITIAGAGYYFTVEADGEATLVAIEHITMLPGTRVLNGGYLHAYISEVNPCQRPFAREEEYYTQDLITDDQAINGTGGSIFFRMYPNPAHHQVTIKMDNLTGQSSVRVEIMDIMGAIVISQEMPARDQYSFDLGNQKPGLYIVKVMQGKQVAVERLIKR